MKGGRVYGTATTQPHTRGTHGDGHRTFACTKATHDAYPVRTKRRSSTRTHVVQGNYETRGRGVPLGTARRDGDTLGDTRVE